MEWGQASAFVACAIELNLLYPVVTTASPQTLLASEKWRRVSGTESISSKIGETLSACADPAVYQWQGVAGRTL